jgi:hypothetical protein
MAKTKKSKKMLYKGDYFYIVHETEDFFFLSKSKDKEGVFVVRKGSVIV